MSYLQTFRTVMAILAIPGLGCIASGAEKERKSPGKDTEQGTVHTVTASMDYPTNVGVDIQARKQPSDFTIPNGLKGTKLKYQFYNPKSGNTRTKLRGSNIYSVTEKRYMHELDNNPDFELPSGQYRFVVGGDPGATGTLTYTTVPSHDGDSAPKLPTPHGTTKGKPTGKTDKTEDTHTVTVLPGGAKKKVVVDFFEAQRPCKLEAYLAIENNRITLDFIIPDLKDENSVTKATSRWDGTLETTAQRMTASGTTNFENVTNYKSGNVARLKMKGTFTATLEGNVLTGSIEDHGQLEATDGGGSSFDSKARWRIDAFTP